MIRLCPPGTALTGPGRQIYRSSGCWLCKVQILSLCGSHGHHQDYHSRSHTTDLCLSRSFNYRWLTISSPPVAASSEACEHVFGICRQIIRDFTMLDFTYLVPKVSIRLREAVISSRFTTCKATASGYNHTYVDHRSLNLVALGVFPTDTEINSIASRAHEEAVDLAGITSCRGNTITLPSIRTWSIDNVDGDQSTDAGTVDDEDNKVLGEDEEACPGELNHVLDELESTSLSSMQEDTSTRLTYASAALTVQESMNLHSLPVPTEEERDEAFAAGSEIINQCLTDTLLIIRALDELRNACDITQHDLDLTDFHYLVKLRFSHQTKQAKNGVRTSEAVALNSDSSAGEPLRTKRVTVLRQFQAIIEEQQERDIGTGAVRSLHRKKTNRTTTVGGPMLDR
ncbi:hypothetical protein BJ138DRAFT_540643 [Hygrophoropsis aurantiaca]|uniref:Uncharacterized protein n=1 Tax=Hygrophoropsis aurantiaca TaxID=72124 RepID=A0ACB8A0Q9_9AGAM|nr:hypothetical protein BJ138DRAFT_540643 [Hygrophoropsis aurantiaca]